MNTLNELINKYLTTCRHTYGMKVYIQLDSAGEIRPFIVGLIYLFYEEKLDVVAETTKLYRYTIGKQKKEEYQGNFKFRLSGDEHTYLSDLLKSSKLVTSKTDDNIRSSNKYFWCLSRVCVAFGKGYINRAKIDKDFRTKLQEIIGAEIKFSRNNLE